MTVVATKQLNTYLPHLELSPDQSQAVDFIMSCPLDQVREKLVRKQVLSEEVVDQAIAEYRKYLVLARLGYDPLEMFSRQVDEVWHAHILFTRDYAEFCQKAFGQFLHHQPHTGSKQTGSEKISQQDFASYFVTVYTNVFGSLSPLWENARLSDCNKSLSDCNKSLSDCNKGFSDCNKSLSDCNKSLSDCNKSLSDCNKSF